MQEPWNFDDLEPDELAFLEANARKRHQHRGGKSGLVQLFRVWNTVVKDVETPGSNIGFEGYADQLSARLLITEIAREGPTSLRQKIYRRLAALDDRFRESTFAIDVPVYGEREEFSTAYWWLYRLPKRMGPRLREGLADAGLFY